MKHERVIRILHTGIVGSMLLQLGMELFIGLPVAGHSRSGPASMLIGVHEAVGSLVLILVCVYLLVVLDGEEGRKRLFPWMFEGGRTVLLRELFRDVPGWFRGRLPPPEESHAIAGTVHGLGMILALLLGLTGTMLFTGVGPHGEIRPDIEPVAAAHDFLTTSMWIFVIGHAGMAVVHELKGHGVLREMFSLRGNQD